MRMRSMRGVGVVMCTMLALSGCASEPDKEDSVVSVEQMHDTVTTGVRDVAESLTSTGLQVPSATGRYVVCGTEPISSVQYRAVLEVTGAGDTSSQVQQAAQAMEDSGWTVTGSGTERGGWSDLERDSLTAGVQLSQRDDGTISVSVVHACVDAAREVVDDVFGQTDQIIG